jgi:tetratricopeptide (TPR) repeat protein
VEHISYTLARLELEGRHYNEALRMYQDILQLEPQSSSAWCGLGMAKFGLLLEQRATVYEIFYCFRKAKEVEPAQGEWVEYLLLQASLKVIEEIYRLFHYYHQHLSKLSGQQGRAVLGTVGSVLIGESRWAESNPYRSLLAAGLTAYSIQAYFKAASSEAQVKAERRQWTHVFSFIRYAVDRHVVVALEDKERFHQEIKRLQRELAEAETPEWVTWLKSIEIKEEPEKPGWTPKMKQYAAYLREQNQILKELEVNPTHPFHRLKREAQVYFRHAAFAHAFRTASEALTHYDLDEDLLEVQEKSRRVLLRPLKRQAWSALVVFAGALGAREWLLTHLGLPGKLFAFLWAVMFLIVLIRLYKAWIGYRMD